MSKPGAKWDPQVLVLVGGTVVFFLAIIGFVLHLGWRLVLGLFADPVPLPAGWHSLEHHNSAVYDLAFDTDNHLYAARGQYGESHMGIGISRWALTNSDIPPSEERLVEDTTVWHLAIDPRGRWVGALTSDDTLLLLDRRSLVQTDIPLPDYGSSIDFSSDGSLLATGLSTGEVEVYALDGGRGQRWRQSVKVQDLQARGPVLDVVFSADDSQLYISRNAMTVQVWDTQRGTLVETLTTPVLNSLLGAGMTVLTDGALISHAKPNSLVQWKIPGPSTVQSIVGFTGRMVQRPDRPNELILVCSDEAANGFVLVRYDLLSQEILTRTPLPWPNATAQAHHHPTELAISPNGRWLAYGNKTGDIMLIDIPQMWRP